MHKGINFKGLKSLMVETTVSSGNSYLVSSACAAELAIIGTGLVQHQTHIPTFTVGQEEGG